jgi:hypothetical protein
MASGSSVFISYAADTKPQAQELTRALENQGIESWVDFKDLQPGQRFKDQLESALGAARWFLVLVGSGNRTTLWQEAEWSAALAHSWTDSDKRVLPVVFGETEPPPFLRNWVFLRVDPNQEPATWTRRVLETMRVSNNDDVHDLSAQNRCERQKRLDEIRKAAEELRESEPGEPPIIADTRPA